MSRRDPKTDSAKEQPRRTPELPHAQFDENPDLWSMASALVQAQAAGAATFAGALALYAETTLRFGERASAALADAAGGSDRSGEDRLAAAANDALTLYLDYVRELSALPGLAGMSFFDHLDRVRARQSPAAAEKERRPAKTPSS